MNTTVVCRATLDEALAWQQQGQGTAYLQELDDPALSEIADEAVELATLAEEHTGLTESAFIAQAAMEVHENLAAMTARAALMDSPERFESADPLAQMSAIQAQAELTHYWTSWREDDDQAHAETLWALNMDDTREQEPSEQRHEYADATAHIAPGMDPGPELREGWDAIIGALRNVAGDARAILTGRFMAQGESLAEQASTVDMRTAWQCRATINAQRDGQDIIHTLVDRLRGSQGERRQRTLRQLWTFEAWRAWTIQRPTTTA